MATTARLVLIRHGRSLWNLENRFTGSTDVPLTETGREEARRSATLLRERPFDIAYTAGLCRAQETLEIVLAKLDSRPPVIRDPALNERNYGDLQGLDKDSVAQRFGRDRVESWRRSYDVAPPGGESLEMTARRTLPFFERAIGGDLSQGKSVLVVAHGNSLRAIIMKLDRLSPEEVANVEVATGVPIAYELAADWVVTKKTILC